MKLFNSWAFVAGLILCGCNQATTTTEIETQQSKDSVYSKDKREITTLIRQVLNWANSNKDIITPLAVKDKKGQFYTGFNLVEHQRKLQELKAANLFAAEFVNNYNQIVLTLDQQLKKGSYGPWLVGDSPGFNFTSNVDPWTLCQDVPYDQPNPYDFVEVEVVRLNVSKGELNWKWGRLAPDYDPGWKKFRYRFRVINENNRWKIVCLEGFDFKTSVAKSF